MVFVTQTLAFGAPVGFGAVPVMGVGGDLREDVGPARLIRAVGRATVDGVPVARCSLRAGSAGAGTVPAPTSDSETPRAGRPYRHRH